jgi:hypothetical protein
VSYIIPAVNVPAAKAALEAMESMLDELESGATNLAEVREDLKELRAGIDAHEQGETPNEP